jgi:hypothetical protein
MVTWLRWRSGNARAPLLILFVHKSTLLGLAARGVELATVPMDSEKLLHRL